MFYKVFYKKTVDAPVLEKKMAKTPEGYYKQWLMYISKWLWESSIFYP